MATDTTWEITTSLRHDPALVQVPDHPTISQIGAHDHDRGHDGTPTYNQAVRSPFLIPDYHRDRLLDAARYFGWAQAADKLAGEAGLRLLTAGIPDDIAERLRASDAAWKLRICVGQDGSVTYDIADTPTRSLESLFPTVLPRPANGRQADIGDGEEAGAAVAHGSNNIEAHVVTLAPRVPSTPVTVIVDTLRTQPSAFTHFKTTSRTVYDDARARMAAVLAGPGVPPAAAAASEILLVSEHDGSVMEGSFTTPYFWRGGRWVTPPVTLVRSTQTITTTTPTPSSSAASASTSASIEFATTGHNSPKDLLWNGGHQGVSRRWALERGLAIEQVVSAASLVEDEECWLSNGVRGFFVGKIKLNFAGRNS
ncbi:4-amino-4-deoxychorismate lyase [Microdochium nivale]|nr:4-amino-4-deoxychorismate lyase [Microdochium nivale]